MLVEPISQQTAHLLWGIPIHPGELSEEFKFFFNGSELGQRQLALNIRDVIFSVFSKQRTRRDLSLCVYKYIECVKKLIVAEYGQWNDTLVDLCLVGSLPKPQRIPAGIQWYLTDPSVKPLNRLPRFRNMIYQACPNVVYRANMAPDVSYALWLVQHLLLEEYGQSLWSMCVLS